MAAAQVLRHEEPSRLQTAVEGYVAGAYQIAPASQTEAEIRGFVTNGDGKEYGVALTEAKEEKPVNLNLAKVRPSWVFSA